MNKKILFLAILPVLLMTTAVMAAPPNWDITGEWTLTFTCISGCGGTYPHTMNVNVFGDCSGAFSGTGFYNDGPSITWTVTGTVDGNNIDFLIAYDGSSYTVDATTGTISTDGKSMSGTATGPGQTFDWTATGTATVVISDCDKDGVLNTQDFCPGTEADISYKTLGEGMNRWIWDGSKWVTITPAKGKGPPSLFANPKISDYTYGCSCEQILRYLNSKYPETYGNMVGHWKYGCSRSILEDWHNGLYYIETVTVPANKDTSTLSSLALQDNKNYVLKAYGTATACDETGCHITFDAEYSTSDGTTWVDGVAPPYDTYGKDLLDLKVNGGFVDWGTYNSAHTYWLPVVGAGTSLPFSLLIDDVYYPNNAGNLNVDIYAKL